MDMGQGMQSESWNDFHQNYHSNAFHYSSQNSRRVRKMANNQGQLLQKEDGTLDHRQRRLPFRTNSSEGLRSYLPGNFKIGGNQKAKRRCSLDMGFAPSMHQHHQRGGGGSTSPLNRSVASSGSNKKRQSKLKRGSLSRADDCSSVSSLSSQDSRSSGHSGQSGDSGQYGSGGRRYLSPQHGTSSTSLGRSTRRKCRKKSMANKLIGSTFGKARRPSQQNQHEALTSSARSDSASSVSSIGSMNSGKASSTTDKSSASSQSRRQQQRQYHDDKLQSGGSMHSRTSSVALSSVRSTRMSP